MNTHEPANDYPDALLDRGLAELLGGETPPDLSEKILAAAQVAVTEPVTLAQRQASMSTDRAKQSSRLRSWALLAASIACIATAIGLFLPARNAARRLSDHDNLAQMQAKKTDSDSAKEQSSPQIPLAIDTDGALWPQASPADVARAKDELMMAVTPHIIIQEGDEERLGIATKEQIEVQINSEIRRRALSAPPEVAERLRQQQELARREKSVATDERNFDWPARRKKYGSVDLSQRSLADAEGKTMPSFYYLTDDVQYFASGGESSGRAGEGGRPMLRGAGQRFRIDNSPRSEVNRYFSKPEELHNPSRDQYAPIHENPFITASGPDAVSTFSIDVDTASYANVRQFLAQSHRLPPPDAVRIEELINYFDYDYAGPTDDTPFAANMEIAGCPWNPEHRLARIAIKGREIDRQARPQSNLVFLVDVSGSMNEPNKLPLLVEGMKLLTRELGENDRVAIVVYASSEGLSLASTRGDQQDTILAALNRLQAGGSTAGGAGINLAYQVATDNFIEGGTNRVILCTDGDFNVGVTGTDALTQLAAEKAKTGVFLTVLGFGRGNLNDAMMEAISGQGNGNYHYVDNLTEARKVLVEEMAGTLITIAKDVKIQVEFNPAQVAGYRLIGYENRMLKTEDFNDDKKDAGEIGAGHTVTALYEIVPAGKEVDASKIDPLKYQQPLAGLAEPETKSAKPRAASNELLTLKLRYKLPDADKSTKLEFPITDKGSSFAEATKDFQFAAAVASFGMLLRHSAHQGETSFDAVQEIAQATIGNDPHNHRAEFLELVRLAKQLQP